MRRAWSRPGLLILTVLTVLTATVFVTAAALTASAAGRGSVGTALARTDPVDRLVQVRADLADVSSLELADTAVRERLVEAFGPVPLQVSRRAVSSSYQLPGRSDGMERLGVLATYQDLEDHARLTAGRWPSQDAGLLQVAVHESAAAELGLEPGDRLSLVNRLDDAPLTVQVVGVVDPVGAESGYWAGDGLGTAGRESGGSFVTFGPFFTSEGAEDSVADAELTWRAEPDLGVLSPDDVEPLRSSVAALVEEGPDDLADVVPGVVVETDVDDVLAGARTPVQVARASVGLPLALVGLLALSALVLLARLLQEDRAVGAALQVSRGFSAPQVWWQNTVEALLASIPAALLAPPLAWATVVVASALAGADAVSTAVDLGPDTWVWSSLCAAVVTVVLLRRGVTRRGGGRARRAWERVGLDLVAVPLAVVAVARLVSSRDGVVEVASLRDPFVVLAIPLVLLALALLVGRLVRVLLVAGAAVAARSRGVVASVASWQLARRVDEHRSLLVAVVLAGSVGAFGAAYLGSAAAGSEEQAALAVGADVRVAGLSGAAAAERVARSVRAAGANAVLVTRERTAVGDLPVDVLAVDADTAGSVLTPTADGAWSSLLAPLGDTRRPPLVGVVDTAVAAESGTAETVRTRVAGTDVAVRPGDTVADLPGVGPEADAALGSPGAGASATGTGLIVDREALADLTGGLDEDVETEVWISADRGEVPAVREAVGDAVPGAVVQDRWSVSRAQQEGPVGAGLRVGLLVGVAAAGIFGVIGFLAAVGAGLRKRRTEVASFRATGLSRRQVGLSLVGERAALLALGALVGTAGGVVTAAVLLPRLVLDDSGQLPSPALTPAVPWPALLTAVGGVLVVSAAVLAFLVSGVVGRPVGDELRRGEDT